MQATASGHYPDWASNPDSALLALCQSLFRNAFQAESTIHAIHAGLGFIGGKYPGLGMVSFGPMICGAHAPGERAEIASVHRCWQLFAAIQAAVP